MDGKENGDSAVLVEDGKIVGIGDLQKLKEMAGSEAQIYDLKGKTLMPAFVDSHSHITMAAQMSMFADLSECASFDQIVLKLKEYAKEKPKQKMIIGFGYDHNVLEERQHPNRDILDQVSKDTPVFIIHVSGHMGVVNSAGLKLIGITEKTKDPEGGRIGRFQDSNIPDGYMEEGALVMLQGGLAEFMETDIVSAMQKAQNIYLQNGITTVQDGAASVQTITLLRTLAEKGLLNLDVVAYPIMTDSTIPPISEEDLKYKNHFRLGGYKIILDGSPQGKSAWLSVPYQNENGKKGYPWMTDQNVLECCKRAVAEERQLLAHCNGDAASEQFLDCYEKAAAECGGQEKDLRPVMIHCQTVREDQIERMSKIPMIASIFVGHVYYWGDVHLENLGEQRGMSISPAGTALKHNVCITFHQDTPVTKPDMLHSVFCAVKRRTRKGILLDQKECISVYEALKAVTIQAAYQYHEEEKKGSIAVGKNADFIILNKDPMSTEESDWNNIRIDVTIKDGKIVYVRSSDNEE